MDRIGHQKGEGEIKYIDVALKLKAPHLALSGAVIHLGFRYHRMASSSMWSGWPGFLLNQATGVLRRLRAFPVDRFRASWCVRIGGCRIQARLQRALRDSHPAMCTFAPAFHSLPSV